MSRFFATVSESESETESSEEELQAPRPGIGAGTFQFSDDEEEAKRIVRSSKEKRYEELTNLIKMIRNHKKIKDLSKMLTCFEDLGRAFTKARPVIDKEEGGTIPIFYIRCLVEMEDFIQEIWEDREGRKNMSKNNSKSLATLRQKLRKYNRDFTDNIQIYRANPEVEDEQDAEEERDSDSDSDSNDDFGVDSFKKVSISSDTKNKFLKGDDDDSDDSYWGSSSDESSSSSSDDEKYGGNLAAKFLKKSSEKDTGDRPLEKKKKEKKEKRERRRDEDFDEGEWKEVKDGVRVLLKPKMFAKDADITHSLVVKKLSEILVARGKKGTDRSEQIDMLQELHSIAEANALGSAISVKIMFAVVSAIYDYNPNIATNMRNEMWARCLQNIIGLLNVLEAHDSDLTVGEHISDDSEVLDAPPYRVRGCMLTIIERLDEEFTKMLQGCDAHSPEYVERLKDEKTVCAIIERLQAYLESRGNSEDLCRIYLRRIEHVYYKFDSSVFHKKGRHEEEYVELKEADVVAPPEDVKEANEDVGVEEGKKTEEEAEVIAAEKLKDGDETPSSTDPPPSPKETKPATTSSSDDSIEVMDRLCKFIYTKDNTDRIRTRAMLCHIYHHALHDNWYEARDLMLMSHLQDNIHHSDVPTQILYNRAMVQVGLCAFRHGNIKDTHNALLDIQSGGRAKELLAQGLLLQRQHERSSEQEKIEKRRQMPFHMHINLELLECVYLVSAMLMEIPYMAEHEFDARRRIISKNFNHQLKISDRQPLVGPPESMREHVVAAARAMRNGNWEACKNYIVNDKMNAKVWGLFHQAEKVRVMLARKIQEETLRTYLFTYSSVYDSISLGTLALMFKLDRSIVHGIVSKMIINEELMVSLDEPTHTVVMHRTEPTRLQSLALQLADKLGSLVENNERIFEMKQGSFFNRGQQGGYQGRQGGGGGGGYQGRGGGGYQQGGQDRSNKWGRRQHQGHQRQYNN